ATAAPTLPPAPPTDTAANCAEPANVVADMTIGATTPKPAERARTPKERPKPKTASASGKIARPRPPGRIRTVCQQDTGTPSDCGTGARRDASCWCEGRERSPGALDHASTAKDRPHR